jgi:hypothetical protein
MNKFFTEVVGLEHTTMAWIEKTLAEVEGKAPGIEKIIDAGITYITPVLQIATNAAGDPALAAQIGAVSAQAKTDLAVASALVTDFGPTPTAASAFTAVQTNLGALLTAGHVKSAQSVAAVSKAMNEVGAIATAVQTAATAIGSAATQTGSSAAPASGTLLSATPATT